ncbi:MAG: protein kinase [Candidatus Eremiobacteraeota bacterium]|nr:protein kinase [Candidatus Eremiobacteraeota bacterium]
MEPLPNGTVLKGRYKIYNIIKSSPRTNIYFVKDLHMKNKIWAVREIFITTDDPQERAMIISRFKNDALILSALEHPKYAKVIDFFTTEDRLFLVREYAPGIDLMNILNTSGVPFPQEKALIVGLQCTEVLEYFYQKGLPKKYYRDIRPQNVIMNVDGTIKIVDMGISHFYVETSQGLMPQEAPGIYEPPETLNEGAEFNERTLVYMLGLLLYHLLTRLSPGESPFKLPPVEDVNPTIKRRVRKIVNKAMNKRTGKRYAYLAIVKKDIKAALSTPGSKIPAVAWLENEIKRSNPLLLRLGRLIIFTLLAILAVYYFLWYAVNR